MYPHLAQVYIDGGCLRALSKRRGLSHLDPKALARGLVSSAQVQTWAYNPMTDPNAFLARISYYDALPDDGAEPSEDLQPYWKAIELQDDVHLGFGRLRGLQKKVRQKGVDTLMAVDMLVGAFSGTFDIAILVASDADFVPVVEEVKRQGVMVAVGADSSFLAEDLRRVADRFIDIPLGSQWLQDMRIA